MPAQGRLTLLLRRILRERTTPARTGLAVALGVLIGLSPFYGLHLFLCVAAATLLGLNRAITYLAANISIPPLFPFLAFASVQAGNFVLHGRLVPVSIDSLRSMDPWTFGVDWLLGSVLVGLVLAAPAGLVSFALMRRFRARHPLLEDPWTAPIDSVGALYRGRGTRGYVRGKLTHDPVARQLAAEAPFPSPVLDLGCGRGQLLLFLATLDPNLGGVGVDHDDTKLLIAREAAGNVERLSWTSADVRSFPLPRSGTIFLIDVLHYLPVQDQDDLVRRAVAALASGGHLYIRDLDRGAGWRAMVTIWQERLGVRLRFNRTSTLCFRPIGQIVSLLQALGLDVRVTDSHGGLPLANVLVHARKP
jgi:uncharacterized protein (DUF2062 family)/SAM-dependent methyltransferase